MLDGGVHVSRVPIDNGGDHQVEAGCPILLGLMAAIDEYVEITNKRVFYEYIMINGGTDRLEYATELGELLKGKLAHVNFIPYNPGEGTDSN